LLQDFLRPCFIWELQQHAQLVTMKSRIRANPNTSSPKEMKNIVWRWGKDSPAMSDEFFQQLLLHARTSLSVLLAPQAFLSTWKYLQQIWIIHSKSIYDWTARSWTHSTALANGKDIEELAQVHQIVHIRKRLWHCMLSYLN
jgi:hypothetical protein